MPRQSFKPDPSSDLGQQYRDANSKFDKTYVQKNLTPHGLKVSQARGKTDTQLMNLAAKTVVGEFKKANPAPKPKPKPAPKPRPKPAPRRK